MAVQIQISPDQLRREADNVVRHSQEMQDLIKKMDNLLARLEKDWKGEAIGGYRDRYNKIKNNTFKNAVELFGEIDKNLRETARILEETDKNIGNQFKK